MGAKRISEERKILDEPGVDIKTLAIRTGMSVPFIRKATRVYGIPYFKLGRNIRFKVTEVFQWMEERRNQ